MIINSEKDLENYIIENDVWLVRKILTLFDAENIWVNLLGNQLRLGNDNITDVCYSVVLENILPGADKPVLTERCLVIVELKINEATLSDFSQICRYVSVASELIATGKLDFDHVKGILISDGQNGKLSDVMQYLGTLSESNIKFLNLKTDLRFHCADWTWKAEYLDELEIDARFTERKARDPDGCRSGDISA